VRRLLGPYALSATYTGAERPRLHVHLPQAIASTPHAVTQLLRVARAGAHWQCVPVERRSADVVRRPSTCRRNEVQPGVAWGCGLTYTWAKGAQTGGDLFSFDYRFPRTTLTGRRQACSATRSLGIGIVECRSACNSAGCSTSARERPSQRVLHKIGFPTETEFHPRTRFRVRDIDVRLRKKCRPPALSSQISTRGVQRVQLPESRVLGRNHASCISYGSKEIAARRRVQLLAPHPRGPPANHTGGPRQGLRRYFPHMTRSIQIAAALAATILTGCGVNHSEGPPPPDSAAPPRSRHARGAHLHYFWDLTNTQNGLTPDARRLRRSRASPPSASPSRRTRSAWSAATSRGPGAQRTLTTLRFFWTAPQDSRSQADRLPRVLLSLPRHEHGQRFQNVELSTIDTSSCSRDLAVPVVL